MSKTPSFPSITDRFLKELKSWTGETPVRIILSENGNIPPSDNVPLASVIIHDRRTLARLILNPEIGFGDAYSEGRIDIQGDLVALVESVLRSTSGNLLSWYSRLASSLLERTQANTLRGSRKNIHHHYDLNADFYKLWLDPRLVYTCAYFPSPSATLEEAQLAKMDYICRKLQLRDGERVVEAGCGWGALALYMAKQYGVKVRAFNIAKEQILFARAQAREEDLSDQVEFIEDDYRNVSTPSDVFVSVGMLEHVGPEHYKDFGRVIHRTIGASGRGLLHFIGRNQPGPFSPWIRKRIFPGAYIPSLTQALRIFESFNISILDVENLRHHYTKTLEHWLTGFERSIDRVREMFGPEFARAWRLYLAGSIAAFRVGNLQLFQVAFAGTQSGRIPWTRAHLYANEQPARQEEKWMHATP